jgi:hypothetical protein
VANTGKTGRDRRTSRRKCSAGAQGQGRTGRWSRRRRCPALPGSPTRAGGQAHGDVPSLEAGAATRAIRAGEEITIDYRLNALDDWEMHCACPAYNAAHLVIGNFHTRSASVLRGTFSLQSPLVSTSLCQCASAGHVLPAITGEALDPWPGRDRGSPGRPVQRF